MRLLPVVLLLVLACVAPASAAVTSSSIASPADPTFALYNADLGANAPANQLVVSGVAQGAAGDRIDVRCFWTDSGGTLRANPVALAVPLGAGGSFSVTRDPAALSTNPFGADAVDDAPGVQTCRLRATPAVGSIAELDGARLPDYAGPRINVARFGSTTQETRSGPDVTVDYGVGAGGLRGQAEWSARCGTFSFRPYVNAAAFSPALFPNWDCVRAILPPDAGDASAQVRVDGAPAYTGASAPAFDFDRNGIAERPAGAAGLSVELQRGLVSGALTTTERSPVQRCVTPAFPPTAASCPTLEGTGVELVRRTVLDDDGLQATITDTWRSTDGRQHSLDVDAEQYVVFDNDPVFRFPGEDAFAPHGPGDQPALGGFGTPATAYTRDAVTPDTPRQGSGAETWDTRPGDLRFFGADYQYVERTSQVVPAGGAITGIRVFRVGRTLAEVEAGARAAEQRLTPPPPAAPPAPAPTPAPEVPTPTRPVAAAKCIVPKLTRSSLYGTARSKIKRAGCAVGKVRRVRSYLRKGRLVAIRPGGGYVRPLGTKISIDLSDGKGKKPKAKAKKPATKRSAAAVARPGVARDNAPRWER